MFGGSPPPEAFEPPPAVDAERPSEPPARLSDWPLVPGGPTAASKADPPSTPVPASVDAVAPVAAGRVGGAGVTHCREGVVMLGAGAVDCSVSSLLSRSRA